MNAVSAQGVICCVFDTPKIIWSTWTVIFHACLTFWADLFAHLLLLKSSILDSSPVSFIVHRPIFMSLILWESSLLDTSTKKRLKSAFDKLEHLTLAVRKSSISFNFQKTFLLAMSSLRKMPSYYLPLMIRATVEHLLNFLQYRCAHIH